MTSSYNLSRRDKKLMLSPINFGAYMKNIGVCAPTELTVPISPGGNCSDWKICVPKLTPDGNLPTVPIMKDIKERQEQQPNIRAKTYNMYSKISPNQTQEYMKKYGVSSYPPPYESQSQTNFYPIKSREIERRELDKKHYFSIPLKFDATGYDKIKPWDYNFSAMGHVQMPLDWEPTQLIQRNKVQEKFY